MSSLHTLLGIRHPLLGAPMAGISGGRLAAAVSRAGGLGFIGGGYCDRDWLVEQLALCEGQPFGVGFISWALARQPELLDLVLRAQPRAVLLSFGELGKLGARVREASVPLIAQVQTVAQAVDAAGLAAALMLGASAACAARPSTPVMNRWRMTKGPWSLRTLRNASTERWAGDLIGLRRTLPEQQKALEHARRHADFDIAPVIAGEATDLVRERRSADAIVADLVQQAAQCLAQPPSAIL